jgi:hypothetical protein
MTQNLSADFSQRIFCPLIASMRDIFWRLQFHLDLAFVK